jgi:hypothetical protein
MQTFVPYGGALLANAGCLDNKRLGKQRVECLQIVNALTIPGSKGWRNHPATRMWENHLSGLIMYGVVMCAVWTNKGYKDTCAEKLVQRARDLDIDLRNFELPEWLSDPEVTRSHKSNLIRKLPEHYGPLWPDVPDDLPYKWPV